jgi:hypothetical protein
MVNIGRFAGGAFTQTGDGPMLVPLRCTLALRPDQTANEPKRHHAPPLSCSMTFVKKASLPGPLCREHEPTPLASGTRITKAATAHDIISRPLSEFLRKAYEAFEDLGSDEEIPPAERSDRRRQVDNKNDQIAHNQ